MARLDIEVVPQFVRGDDPVFGVALLVDGEEVLRSAWGGVARDPDRLLRADSPLLPGPAPRDVVLRCCGCGEAGCGALVARLRLDGDEVVWDRFRDGTDNEDDPGRPMDELGAIRFGRAQYEAEVRRAHEERPWETPEMTVARHVSDQLRGRPLTAVRFDFAVVDVDGILVSVTERGRQRLARFPYGMDAEAIVKAVIDEAPP